MKEIYRCEECKGDNIYFEAEVVWNSKNREFEYDRLTYTYCNDCEDVAMVDFYMAEEDSLFHSELDKVDDLSHMEEG